MDPHCFTSVERTFQISGANTFTEMRNLFHEQRDSFLKEKNVVFVQMFGLYHDKRSVLVSSGGMLCLLVCSALMCLESDFKLLWDDCSNSRVLYGYCSGLTLSGYEPQAPQLLPRTLFQKMVDLCEHYWAQPDRLFNEYDVYVPTFPDQFDVATMQKCQVVESRHFNPGRFRVEFPGGISQILITKTYEIFYDLLKDRQTTYTEMYYDKNGPNPQLTSYHATILSGQPGIGQLTFAKNICLEAN